MNGGIKRFEWEQNQLILVRISNKIFIKYLGDLE